MADPLSGEVLLAIVIFAIGMGALAFFEIRLLRKRMKGRRKRYAKRDDELADQAHNAIVTTSAIISAMARQGVRSEEASASLREAEMAFSRKNYRVVLELTSKTRERLMSVKAEQASKGDLAKLEQLATAGGSAEETTKERIQKEFPPNLLQSKFSIELAETSLEAARSTGMDTAVAAQLLDTAKAQYEAHDYDAALRFARQSKRSAEGVAVEVDPAPPAAQARQAGAGTELSCPSCRASIREDDVFCRKCGARLVPEACASCGTQILADDAYCPKCGVSVSR